MGRKERKGGEGREERWGRVRIRVERGEKKGGEGREERWGRKGDKGREWMGSERRVREGEERMGKTSSKQVLG